MICRRCIERGKLRGTLGALNGGSAPRCAFDTPGGHFTDDNWNCATANAIRELLMSAPSCPIAYSQEQRAALVPIDLDNHLGTFLIVSWYKDRGRTDVLSIVCGEERLEPLPLAAADELIAYLERKLLGVVPTPPEHAS